MTNGFPSVSPDAVVICGLRKSFGRVVAVRGVDFTVGRGEIVGVLGPNGAGKTTLLRMIAGVLTPSSGSVAIDGVTVRVGDVEPKRRIGFLSGDTALYARLTVRETLAFFGRLHGFAAAEIGERVRRLAADFDLHEFLDRRCGVLSSGQRQRANLARALLHDPSFLLLDEPTAALDVVGAHFVREMMRAARRADRAILLATHDMAEVESLADRIVLLGDGRVLDQGTVSEVLGRARVATLAEAFLAGARGDGPSREGRHA